GSYKVSVYNAGTEVIPGVSVEIRLPALVYRGFSGSGWSCALDDVLRCTSNQVVPPNSPFNELDIDMLATAAAVPTALASVQVFATDDGNPANDTWLDPTNVAQPFVDAAIESTTTPICLSPGQLKAQVKNVGGQAMSSVRVTIDVPSILRPTSVSGAGWNCSP